MSPFLRLLFLAALSWIGFVLLREAHIQAHLDNPDKQKVMLLFGGLLVDGLALAIILALMVVPAIGNSVGNFFFSPNVEIEPDPHAGAIAKLAQGDPEGAIARYEDIFRKDPSDTLALSEIARICCRDPGDTARGAAVIERALEAEWPHEQSSFLANRLADIYMLQGDPLRARQVIMQIAQTMEGTKYAANAQHRLNEIDRSLEVGSRSPEQLKAPAPEEPPAGQKRRPPTQGELF